MATLLVVCVVLCILVYSSVETKDNGCYRANVFDPHLKPNRLSKYLEGYRDVCACVNIHFNVNYNDTWSINSYDKDLLAYFEPNCLQKKWKAWYTVDRSCKNVINIFELKQMNEIDKQNRYTIRSFGPDPNSEMFKTRCKNNANLAIMGIELLETENKFTNPMSNVNAGKMPKNSHLLQEYNHLIHFFGLANFQGMRLYKTKLIPLIKFTIFYVLRFCIDEESYKHMQQPYANRR